MQTVEKLRSQPQFRSKTKNAAKYVTAISLFLAYFLTPAASYANTITDINKTVSQFLAKNTVTPPNGQIELIVGRLDSRLRLRDCKMPLEAFLPNAGQLRGKVTIGVRCKSKKPWTLYVPAEILIFNQVIVSLHPLRRGHIIRAGDITRTRMKTSDKNATYFTDSGQVIGKVLTQHLSGGKIISARILQAQRLVHRGQAVTLIAISNDLQVRTTGKALGDGAFGDVIRVKNLKSNRIIEGIVKKQGTVQVIM
jgi:flagella basal body P-ring formation protein FlgA